MHRVLCNISTKEIFPDKINLYFKSSEKNCSCGEQLQAYKTKLRRISTLLTGECNAHTTQHYCENCKKIYSSQELKLIVPQNSHFGFDVIVHVGTSLFVNHCSDEEIKQSLHEKNISISLREISYLGKKFIIYLALAHHACQDKIKKRMQEKGGYILHLDGTCEGDSPHLFSFIDQVSNIVLNNIKIPSENTKHITPALEELKITYDNPIAIVHDMSTAIINSVQSVFPDVKDFICHLHFLRDLGKDLFNTEYNCIRNRIKTLKVRTSLRKLLRELKIYIDQNQNLKNCLAHCMKKNYFENQDVLLSPPVAVYILVAWVLESKNKSHGYGFPFDRQHVDFCDRLQIAYPLIKNLNKEMPIESPKLFLKKLSQFLNDVSLTNALKLIKEKILIFDELRDAMRIVPSQNGKGLNDDGGDIEIKTIEYTVKKFRESKKIMQLSKTDLRFNKMIKQIDKYWNKLFADPIEVKTENGIIIIQPQRTNNMLEQFFRDIKSDGRKKSGTSSLSKKLKAMVANTPLVKNLKIPEYVEMLLNGKKDLAERFAEIDIASVRAGLQKENETARKYPKGMAKIFRMSDLPNKIWPIGATTNRISVKSNQVLRS